MKMNKKKVLVVALAVSLIAILSLGSLAWFNAADEVTNKFHVATDDESDSPEFTIDVKENATDETGMNFVDKDSDGAYDLTDTGNTYEWVVPGDEIKKNPMVTNTGDYDQWVRVNISISRTFADKVAIAQGVADYKGINFETLFTNFNTAAVETARVVVTPYSDYYTYAYYLKAKLAPGETVKMFDAVNIPTSFTQADMTYGSFQIIVKAEAVQADNTGSSASAAFTYVQWPAGKAYGEQ